MKCDKGFTKAVLVLAILLSVALVGVGPLKKTCLELYADFKAKGTQLSEERKKFSNYARAKLSPQEIKKLFTPKKDKGDDKDELKRQDRIDLERLLRKERSASSG